MPLATGHLPRESRVGGAPTVTAPHTAGPISHTGGGAAVAPPRPAREVAFAIHSFKMKPALRGGAEAALSQEVAEKVRANTLAVLKRGREEKLLPRQAAEELARERVRKAMNYRARLNRLDADDTPFSPGVASSGARRPARCS